MIKEFLIHTLGGMTQDEVTSYGEVCEKSGKRVAYLSVKSIMDDMYGIDADTWCRNLYEAVEERLNDGQADE